MQLWPYFCESDRLGSKKFIGTRFYLNLGSQLDPKFSSKSPDPECHADFLFAMRDGMVEPHTLFHTSGTHDANALTYYTNVNLRPSRWLHIATFNHLPPQSKYLMSFLPVWWKGNCTWQSILILTKAQCTMQTHTASQLPRRIKYVYSSTHPHIRY